MDNSKKILIVDDDARNIFALRLVLKAKGYTCITASEAEESLALLRQDNNIAVVLLDMMMPGQDGYETLRIIRNEEGLKDIPVIAVTAQAMPGDREKCLSAGASGYLSKPVDVDRLIDLLNNLYN